MQEIWNSVAHVELAGQFKEWAENLTDKISAITSESAETYQATISDHDGSLYSISILPHPSCKNAAALEKIYLDVDLDQSCVEISEFYVNKKGSGLGRRIAVAAVEACINLNFRQFKLDARYMGPDFWPQFGFRPALNSTFEMEEVKKKYQARFDLLKSYLPVVMAADIAVRIKKFNEETPAALSKIRAEETVKTLCGDDSFLNSIGIFLNGEPDGLNSSCDDLHHIITEMKSQNHFKLGALLNGRIGMNMELDLTDKQQASVFYSMARKTRTVSSIAAPQLS